MTSEHYLKPQMVAGKSRAMLLHDKLDRTVKHTSGDLHGECSSQRRVDKNFVLLCSERLPATSSSRNLAPADELQRARQVERQLAAEERVRQRYRERIDRRLAAETRMLPAPPAGSTLARRRREQLDELRPSSAPPAQAYARWQRQFGRPQSRARNGASERRLTGQYVHSLDEPGVIERTPASFKSPGKQRLSATKSHAYFTGGFLRAYSPRPSPRRGLVSLSGGAAARASSRVRTTASSSPHLAVRPPWVSV
jgi:hypothetical protein